MDTHAKKGNNDKASDWKAYFVYVAIMLSPLAIIVLDVCIKDLDALQLMDGGTLVVRGDINASKHLYPYLASLIVVALLLAIIGYITCNGSTILAG